jgi:hypothetical protein
MRSLRRPLTTVRGQASRIGLAALAASALGLLRCSPERTVLVTLPTSEAGGATALSDVAGGGGVGPSAGSGNGDASGAQSGTTSAGGADAAMGGGMPTGGSAAIAGSETGGTAAGASMSTCTSHGDCNPGSVCLSNVCQACAAAAMQCPASCPAGFSMALITRNGCSLCECVPPSTCTGDQDCVANEVCYAGAQCQEGCSTPDCCFGNHCDAAGCGSTTGLNCGAVGCPSGGQCFSVCAEPACHCDGTSWHCQGDGAAGSSGSCQWVCTSR